MSNIRTIDYLGRIVIPKEIRRALEIEEGDVLEINIDPETNKITIEKPSSEDY